MRKRGGEQRINDAVDGFGEDKESEPDEFDLPEESPEHVTDEIFSEGEFLKQSNMPSWQTTPSGRLRRR